MNDFKIHFTDGSTLVHIGIKGRSGRYPLGSGERPYQDYPHMQKKVRLKYYEKKGLKQLDRSGISNYPDFYDRLTPAQRGIIERGIQANKISSDFKSKYDASKAGAGERAQKRKEEEIKRKMEEEQQYKETKKAFETSQKLIKDIDDFDKMLQLANIDDVRRFVYDADEEGWASKEFMTKFKIWDFTKHYYENEFDYFALPDEIKRDIDGAIKTIENKYYKNGEFVSTGDKYLDINIPDAHWRLLKEKDPNVTKFAYPSTVKYYETHIDELAKRLKISTDEAKEELEKMKK